MAEMISSNVPPPITYLALSFEDFEENSDYNRSVVLRLMEWINFYPSREALRTLHVGGLGKYGLHALKAYLNAFGSYIKHLRLRAFDYFYCECLGLGDIYSKLNAYFSL